MHIKCAHTGFDLVKPILNIVALLAIFSSLVFTQSALAESQSLGLKPIVIYKSKPNPQSFLGLIEKGLDKTDKLLGIETTRKIITKEESYTASIINAVKAGYDPIISVYATSTPQLSNVMKAYPGTRFVLYDISFDIANSLGILFDSSHAAYILGYLAGSKTESGKVGFIGGIDNPAVENFRCGFELGLHDASPNAALYSEYVGTTSDAWLNSTKAEEIAEGLIEQGIDVLFPVAGFASQGVYKAASENSITTFGVDTNQNDAYSHVVMASMLKHVDDATFAVMKQLYLGIWNSNHKHFGTSQNMVEINLNPEHQAVREEDKVLLEQLSNKMKMTSSGPLKALNRNCSRHF
ncbi:membrane protein [Vibrio variabilis]|uniref:Membrane protein n=1 Tax=Vibrio variabilis TaxID=990271 RepID=A0ABR4YAP5_9VIBR|nr:membrane protein [Vibrio variabilis]